MFSGCLHVFRHHRKGLVETHLECFQMTSNDNVCLERPCHPLKSIDELLSFRQFCCSFKTAKNYSDDDNYKQPLPNRPRVLLCHDFAGGYLEDRYYCSETLAEERKITGKYDPAKDYCFDYWNRIDVFVYFSHNFITVPPCEWIRQAHSNGVKVLGTIIIEWDAKLLKNFLFSQTRSAVVENLVELCAMGNFDGWLFNMEVSVNVTYVKELRELIASLKQELAQKVPGSLVLWYDSMTTSGTISYQDALTEKNKPFFDDCDGIFLNYGWNNKSLERSKLLADERAFDVFVGIDVFGRGTKYKAGFNTAQVAQDVTKQGLSAAIFAPGWVLECNKIEKFPENQEKFWGGLPVLR